MTSANRRPAPGGNANTSRSAGVRLKGRESWRRLFQRGKRNLRSAEGFIGMARQIIDVCETIAAEHPIKAIHDMQRVTGLLVEAADRLDRLGKCICATYDRIAEAPAYAGDAPARMIADLQSWIETGTKLVLLGNRFDKSFAELIEYAQSGNAPLDMSELLKRRVHPVPVLARHPAPKVLSIENDRIFCIHLRRQRSLLVTVAEAPKRVSRGRAPPLVSTCSL
ncbi:MAG TPA: hypothetical protein VN380_24795 [Thermoanaerobaculia bacterium]|jgi:hypothetical protein|nr:hypothetical protein [Thermoanaerobaculia bacterium]